MRSDKVQYVLLGAETDAETACSHNGMGGLFRGTGMTLRNTAKLTALAGTLLLLPACATVDVASMGMPEARVTEAPAEANVVQRAVAKLKTAFTQRGFGPKASKRKMHAAADVLLNGINREAATDADGYNAQPRSRAMVTADILVASSHVERTTRAATVYLEMAPSDRRLDEELVELEAALLVSERAVRAFGVALDTDDAPELLTLRERVDGLRRITDEFGFRVRADKNQAADAALAG